MTTTPNKDDRAGQAERVADYLHEHPDSTLAEIDRACDLGSATKVLSAMRCELGYGVRRGWRWAPCVNGGMRRRVRTYTLTHRPARAAQLSLPLE